jgi:ABC-type antimicrobial peptide transport system permease subunit
MVRLGLYLALRSGREALTRFILIALAVAIGVAMLLVVLSDFHAFQTTVSRPWWEGTEGVPVSQLSEPSNAELWNYSEDFFKGQLIERLDVAALGPDAPVVPGIPGLPGPGQYYASPALAALLSTVPSDELGDRFPGSQIGIIGNQALSGPDELVIIIGYTPQQLAALPGTVQVDTIYASPRSFGTTNIYRFAFAIGAIVILLPILVLIGTATRLAATRREERYAALRLVGATPGQVNIIASVDAVASALLGAMLGIGIFALVQPAVAGVAITGAKFFPKDVTPTLWGYIAVVIGVPVAAAVASVMSLQRVRISPLGVSRKVTPPAPKMSSIIPLLVGVPLFIGALLLTKSNNSGFVALVALLGFVLAMVGMIVGGPWLTMQLGRLLARFTGGASSLLAARRLTDNPQAAFRAVSGLVLAVLLGTGTAVFVPSVVSAQHTPNNALSNVLRDQFLGGPSAAVGLAPQTGAQLISQLQAYPGVTVLPIYHNPAEAPTQQVPQQVHPGGPPASLTSVVGCESLAQFPVLGQCPPGAQAVMVDTGILMTNDNPLWINRELPIVTLNSPTFSGNISDLYMGGVLVRADNPDTLEKVRTLLTTYGALSGSHLAPETFGEVSQVSATSYLEAERIAFFVVALTLVVAGCSLAVTVVGSLVERKRPFTLLRLSGTPTSALNKVVLLESVLPLAAAALVAAGMGYALTAALIKALSASSGFSVAVAAPGLAYYLTMVGGLAISLIVIILTLPLMGSTTKPENARFE